VRRPRIDPAADACLNRGMPPALIAIDWGSSSFRAYLLSPDGQVLEEIASSDGIASVAAGAYPATLRRLLGRWLEANPSLPVIASGMVGSRHGWRETTGE
jgi:2-dehydro-3-deoxygalactonokinase